MIEVIIKWISKRFFSNACTTCCVKQKWNKNNNKKMKTEKNVMQKKNLLVCLFVYSVKKTRVMPSNKDPQTKERSLLVVLI